MRKNVPPPAKADEDTWHHHMGHTGGKTLGILKKTDINGIIFTGGVSAGDVCSVGNSTQQTIPKTAKLNVEQSLRANMDLLGPITLTAPGGFKCS